MKKGTYHKKLGLLLFLLLLSAHVAATTPLAAQEINNGKLPTTITPFYREICTRNTFVATNKPPIFVNVINFPNFDPGSCIDLLSSKCREETETINAWKQNTNAKKQDDLVLKSRDETTQMFQSWEASSVQGLMGCVNDNNIKLTDFQYEQTKKAFIIMARKKSMLLKNSAINKLKSGRCGEFLEATLARVFYKKLLDKNDKMRVYRVEITEGTSDHTYLMFSEKGLPEVSIVNNPRGVARYFSNLKHYYACDPWNAGYFADHTAARNIKLYQGAGYSNLIVEECHPQPSYEGIPGRIATYLRELNNRLDNELRHQFDRMPEIPNISNQLYMS